MISVLAGLESIEHPLLTASDVKKSILLVLTSNRGLCGSYNASILRTALEHQRQLEAQGLSVEIHMVGKKGAGYLRFLGRPAASVVTDVDDKIAYARVSEMADRYMEAYLARQVGRVEVAYMRFLSVGSQKPAVTQLIPVEPPKSEETSAKKGGMRPDFEFSPPPAELLSRLIPETVKIRLYQCFNDAIVSEQVNRMVAMKAATDAAGDMIKALSSEYNRARQSQITLELADIVGGAEAVKA
jgi:F-type H+-transporting ATPase subunit gamma